MQSEILRLNSHLEGEMLHGERPFTVACTLPGDRIDYEVIGRGRRKRVLVQTHHPGDGGGLLRQEPFCPQFGRCGGCRGQHLSYDDQFRLKSSPYIEGMRREFGLDVLALPALISRGYRNRMDFVVAVDVLGLRPAGSFRGYVDVPSCGIQRRRADSILSLVREILSRHPGASHHRRSGQGSLKYLTLREGEKSGAVILTLCEGQEDVPAYRAFAAELQTSLAEYEHRERYRFSLIECSARAQAEISAVPGGHSLFGETVFEESMGPLSFRVPYDAFFQPNPPAFFQMFRAALAQIEAHGLWQDGPVLDLYCGSAVLSLLAAEIIGEGAGKGREAVHGIFGADFSPSGVELGRRNIQEYLAEKGRSFPFRLDARDLSRGEMDFPKASLAILDPPRAGLAQGVIRWIRETRPASVLLSIACSPMTQIENLKSLMPSYRPLFAVVADPFPQTPHLESAVVLVEQ